MSLEEALNPNTPATRLQEILDFKNPELCQAIAINPNSPPEILLKLFERYPLEVLNNPVLELILLEIPDFFEQLLAKNYPILMNLENLPKSILKAAINHPDPKIYRWLIWRDNLPGYCLEKLAEKEVTRIRQGVATHKNTSIHILEKLAEDRDYEVRASLASRQNLPICIIEKLANDEHYYVRSSIMYNKNAPIHILEKLARDKDDTVRSYLAFYQDIPSKILEKLATDRSPKIRLAVANNPNINPTIIKLLFENQNYRLDSNNLSQIQQAIELEIKRLNWTEERAIKCFKEKYNNRYFNSLSKEELLEFWQYLSEIESNTYPTSLRKNVFIFRIS